MSYLKLNPDVRDQVNAEADTDVPDPNSPAFEPFLADLKETRPELAEALVQGLEVEGAELPEEVQARRAGRREGRKNIIRRFFFSRNYEEAPNLNKRKTLFVIVGVLVAALPFAFLVDQLAARRAAAREASLVTAAVVDEPLISSVAPPTLEVQPSQVDDAVTKSPDLPSPPSSPAVRDALPPPPGPVDTSVAGAPPDVASSSSSRLSIAEQLSSASAQPQGLNVFSGQPLPPTTLSLSTATTAPEHLSLVPSVDQGNFSSPSGIQATRLNLLAEAQTQPAPASTLGVLTKDKLPDDAALTTPPQSASLELSNPKPSESKSSDRPPPYQASAQQGMTEGNVLFPTPPELPKETSLIAVTQNVDSPEGVATDGENTPVASDVSPIVFQLGSQIPARLATGIAVTEGMSTPVVAETLAGGMWCGESECPAVIWLGTAKLARPGRIDLRLEQAVVNGEARTVTAVALGEDNVPGLAAAVSDTSPTVVQDLLRAAAGGVSDYVETLANRQTVTTKEGGVVIRDVEVPSLDQFLLGRAAKLFDLPSAQTAVVRVAQVADGTELVVLYGVGE